MPCLLKPCFLGLPFPPTPRLGPRAAAQESPLTLPMPSRVALGTLLKLSRPLFLSLQSGYRGADFQNCGRTHEVVKTCRLCECSGVGEISMIITSLGKSLAASQGLLGPGEARQRGLPRRVFQAQALDMLQLPLCYDPAGIH